MIHAHLLNRDEFWGRWVIPSIARSDPAFPEQRYWKGAIWPPLNFLTYLSLRRSGHPEVASQVAAKSLEAVSRGVATPGICLRELLGNHRHRRRHRLSSDRFHSWGALMGVMAFVEAGALPDPAAPLASFWSDEDLNE